MEWQLMRAGYPAGCTARARAHARIRVRVRLLPERVERLERSASRAVALVHFDVVAHGVRRVERNHAFRLPTHATLRRAVLQPKALSRAVKPERPKEAPSESAEARGCVENGVRLGIACCAANKAA